MALRSQFQVQPARVPPAFHAILGRDRGSAVTSAPPAFVAGTGAMVAAEPATARDQDFGQRAPSVTMTVVVDARANWCSSPPRNYVY